MARTHHCPHDAVPSLPDGAPYPADPLPAQSHRRREALLEAVGKPDAVVSCVGAIGFDMQGLLVGNGIANVEGAKAAKAAGASRFVYVSVASEVADSRGWLPNFFGGYFDGKAQAEAAIVECFGAEGATFVRPSFIYGGDSFGLFPPRVNDAYGSGVEELLSSSEDMPSDDVFFPFRICSVV